MTATRVGRNASMLAERGPRSIAAISLKTFPIALSKPAAGVEHAALDDFIDRQRVDQADPEDRGFLCRNAA